MRRLLLPLLGLLAAAILVAGCGGYGTAGQTTAPAPGAGKTAGVTLTTAASKLGTLLTDGGHRTVYLFEKDARGMSACSGACASLWPPLTSAGGRLRAGGGAESGLLGTTTRPDGARQVTYAGHPLYYYAADQHPGDTTGQALDQFGAPWFALAPSGAAIGG
ncbi:MAG TPA: hypothetical protein VLB47_09055 [Solirubrobacteraceae bacterium]|nr:hypothetical protein [Solirubrobacteraceae bacterium]